MTDKERCEIIEFSRTHSWSYQLIADHFGVTRNQVAGLLFRHNNGGKRTVGRPRSGPGAYPSLTAQNSR